MPRIECMIARIFTPCGFGSGLLTGALRVGLGVELLRWFSSSANFGIQNHGHCMNHGGDADGGLDGFFGDAFCAEGGVVGDDAGAAAVDGGYGGAPEVEIEMAGVVGAG